MSGASSRGGSAGKLPEWFRPQDDYYSHTMANELSRNYYDDDYKRLDFDLRV